MIRKVSDSDRETVTKWLLKDEYHKHLTPEFFLVQEPNTELMCFHDERGPVLFVKLERALRVYIQFDHDEKVRNAKMLVEGFPWLKQMAKSSGFRQVIFDSVSGKLVNFCMKRLGFRKSPDEFVATI